MSAATPVGALQGAPGEKTAAYVDIQNVSKTYRSKKGDVHALDRISVAIGEREFVSIVGPSGCGKSTLLMLVAGLYTLSSGRITVGNQVVRRPVTNLGIVFQKDLLLEWRTVLNNVMLQPEIRRLPKAEHCQRAMQLLEQVGLREFADKYPAQLSGGMRQRASICRALVHESPLLLMDEPFGALDALTRDQMNLDLLHIWDSSRKTVLFITHSIAEAVFLSDRVVVMSPRPGSVREILTINLPRPRRLAMRETAEFAALSRQIRQHFEAMGVLKGD